LKKLCGLPREFHHFSDRRLDRIQGLVRARLDPSAAFDFYHGATPWSAGKSPRPYGSYIDASFDTYLDIYHDRTKFSKTDIQRICRREAEWLAEAACVFCASDWALKRTVAAYSISERNFRVVWIGGNTAIPLKAGCPKGFDFVFVALDFVRKGGHLCVEAFTIVRKAYPQATLTIVGQCPPEQMLQLPGVRYAGLLRKTNPKEAMDFEGILATAFAIIHPTTMDTIGQVLIEAGYHGCPAIATNDFAIPEIVKDKISGFLIKPPLTADAFAGRMLQMCGDRERYLRMREAARAHTTGQLTWEAVIGRIVQGIERVLPSPIQVAKP
jgi:glycosyltransferase involved in cell wall biosynthesis